jgi:hypothetical protein
MEYSTEEKEEEEGEEEVGREEEGRRRRGRRRRNNSTESQNNIDGTSPVMFYTVRFVLFTSITAPRTQHSGTG